MRQMTESEVLLAADVDGARSERRYKYNIRRGSAIMHGTLTAFLRHYHGDGGAEPLCAVHDRCGSICGCWTPSQQQLDTQYALR
jgi:hypothetical protein